MVAKRWIKWQTKDGIEARKTEKLLYGQKWITKGWIVQGSNLGLEVEERKEGTNGGISVRKRENTGFDENIERELQKLVQLF